MPEEHHFEIQLGVYATEDDARRLVEECGRLLDGRALPYRLSLAGPGECTTGPEPVPLAAFYEDLPEQWRVTRPGAAPGSRSVQEIRVGVRATRAVMDTLREDLTRVLCPDPGHRSPCPVPWASRFTGHTDPTG